MRGERERAPRGAWAYALCVTLVLAGALALRLVGIPSGEPFPVHPDEPLFVERALTILTTGDWNPHWFGHPGSFTIYSLSIVYAWQAWFGGVPLERLLYEYAVDVAPFHALGKQWIVGWSMLGHVGLLLLARQLMPKWPSLLAVLWMATARIDIDIATLIRTDTQQSTLLVFLCLCLVRAMKTGRAGWFVGAGLLLGLATAVKWPSVVACLSIVLAVALASEGGISWPPTKKQLELVGAAALASALGLFLGAPFVYLDFTTVLTNVAQEARAYHLSATNPGFFSALVYYLDLLRKSLHWWGMGLALLGVVWALGSSPGRQEPRRRALVPLSIFVLYLVFIAAQNLRWARWTVPLVPFACLFAAMGVAGLCAWIERQARWGPRARAVEALVVSALLFGLAEGGVEIAEGKLRPSESVLVARWIETHLPEGSALLSEASAPAVPAGRFEIFEAERTTGALRRVDSRARYVLVGSHISALGDIEGALRRVDYVLVGPYHKRLRAEGERHARAVAQYDRLFKATKTVKKFGDIQIRAVRKR